MTRMSHATNTFGTAICSVLQIGYGLAEMIVGDLQIVAFGDAIVMTNPRWYHMPRSRG